MHLRNTRLAMASVIVSLFCTFTMATPNLSIDPTTLDSSDPSEVAIDVTGLNGSSVVLRLYVDADGDGTIDPEDLAIWTDVVEDDFAEWSPEMASDLDPASGAVSVDVRVFTPMEFPHSAGEFIWEAEDSFDSSTDTVAFSVTQTPQSQSVSGSVTDSATLLPLPGALVFMEPFCDGGEEARRFYSAFTDDSGSYSIEVPADLDCHHRLLVAVKPGYLTEFLGQPHLIFGGSDDFVGQDLELTPGSYAVSGRATYETGPRAGQGIPGLAIFVELDEGPPLVSVAFTDENGDYAFLLEDGAWAIESPEEGLAARGAVSLDETVLVFEVTGGPLALADLELPAANAFFSGTLEDDGGGALAGHWVSAYRSWPCDPDCYSGEALTRSDGSFTVGVFAPAAPATNEYSLNVSDPVAGLIAEQRGCEEISAGETLTGRDLHHLAPTGLIKGRLMDKSGQGLENLCVEAWGSSASCNGYQATVVASCDGSYEMPVVDGEWNLRVGVDDLAAVYRDLDETEVSRDFTVSGADVEGVDFILGGWSHSPTVTAVEPAEGLVGSHVMIEGFGFSFGSMPQVFFDGLPAALVDFRPDLGSIIVEVPAGLAPGDHDLTVYNVDLGQTSEPACFATAAGSHTPTCTISGAALDLGTFGFVQGAVVVVLADYGESFVRADVTNAAGNWSVGLEAAGDYMVSFVPPQGQPWIWGQYLVSCGDIQNHGFQTGWQVTGRVTTNNGDGLANASVEAEENGGNNAYSFAATDDDGQFTLVLPTGDFDFSFDPPPGSRFIAPPGIQQTVSGHVDLGQVGMNQGFYFCGSVTDAARDGLHAEIDAYRKIDGSWASFADTAPCDGRFDLALAAGVYRLEILADDLETDGPTQVKFVEVSGDTIGRFDFVVYDRNALQLTGPEPRIGFVDPDGPAQTGQPLHILAENAGGATVDVLFSDGLGGFVVGDATGWDAARGMVMTRVPALAASGPLALRVDGVVGPSVPFELEHGSFPAGAYEVSGTVTGSLGSPLPGALVALFWSNPSDPDCDDDDGLLVDYAMTDAFGSYGPLTHPGGDFFIAFLPPTAGGLAPGGDERQGVFSAETIDASLLLGFSVHLRVTDDEPAANPIPNALVEFGADGAGDFRLTDANGEATLLVAPGDVWFELIPPVESRLVEQEWQATIVAPFDYGDVAMTRGLMVGSGVAREDDGTPLAGVLVNAWRDDEPYDFFFESQTGHDGSYRGPVPFGATFQVRVESPDDLADAQKGGLFSGSNDRIVYPGFEVGPAGLIEGVVREAGSSLPLAEIELSSQADEQGLPGEWNGWTRTCPDGTYRMKLPVGAHFLHANNSFSGNGYVEKWYPDAYCSDSASSVVVTAGNSTSVDFDLDQHGSISGDVQVNLSPIESAGVCAQSDALGCQFCNAQSDAGGDYVLSVPPAPDYRVSSWASGVGMQCYDGADECVGFQPVTVSGGNDTGSVDFRFGCASGSELFLEQMESGAPGWVGTGLWHLGSDPACTPSSKSGSTAFHYASPTCDFDTGGANSGTLTSPTLSGAPAGLSLSFWQRRETDGNCSITDRSRVRLWVNGSGPTDVWEECDNANEWTMRLFDLTPYYAPGDDLQLEFDFDSVDGSANQYLGWMIDDVRLFACDPEPPAEPSGAGGSAPLRLTGAGSSSLVVEQVAGATAYNVYVDPLGSYYSPTVADGTACTITSWNDNFDGTVTLDVAIPPDSWVLVSASNVGGESAVGVDADGTDRRSVGTWEACPLGPPAGGGGGPASGGEVGATVDDSPRPGAVATATLRGGRG